MSHETNGTVLILRMELVLDMGSRVKEIACWHLNIYGNTVVCLCDIHSIFPLLSFLFLAQTDRTQHDLFCSLSLVQYILSERK